LVSDDLGGVSVDALPTFESNEHQGTMGFGRRASAVVGGAARYLDGEGHEMGDLVYLLIVAAFFALSIGYARIAPRL
jgi:hypothetical protein